jgi:hypothetical protein
MPNPYPLDWPVDTPRSPDQTTSRFKTSFTSSLEALRKELRLLGATSVCISTNLPPARDGWPDPRARLKNLDPGVAVYWIHTGKIYVIACDAWDRVEDNLHAIMLTIAADRAKTRHRCAAIEARSMAGYLALPAPSQKKRWWEVFGCTEDAPIDEVRAIYRARMKRIHPDFSQDKSTNDRKQMHEETIELNEAMAMAERSKNNVA